MRRTETQSPFLAPFALLLTGFLTACSPSPSAQTDSGAGGSGDGEASQDPAAEEASPLERVRVMPLLREDIQLSLDAVANVESLDVVDVVPERAEPVLEILVEEGDEVQEGQVLARLRDRIAKLAVREAEVRVLEAENELARAKRDHKRNLQLAEGPDGASLLSDRDLETSLTAMLAAETALESAQVALDQAQVDLDRCTLYSPITGTVTARELSVGDLTMVGVRAFEVTDLANPRVIFYRPQSEIGKLKVGQKLTATSEAYPGLAIDGEIERVSPVVDSESGTVKVTATLSPSEGIPMPTGLLLRVRLVLDEHPQALLVPKRALIFEQDRILVYAIREGKAVEIEMAPGFENPEYLEHLGEGLADDDVVVTVGQDRLEDGEEVEVLPQ
jgi:membrane fusion protein (multidrug efflux system)